MAIFSNLLTPSGRRNRVSYTVIQLALLVSLAVVAFIFMAPVEFELDDSIGSGLTMVSLGLLAILVAISWMTAAQRVRDIGYSGWWVLIFLVPYIGQFLSLALFVWPGTKGDNAYGHKGW